MDRQMDIQAKAINAGKLLSTKSGNIVVNETELQEFVLLSTNACVSLFGSARVQALQSMQDLLDSAAPMKNWLAEKLKERLGQDFSPESMSTVFVVVDTSSCCVRVSFNQITQDKDGLVIQPWTIGLVDDTGLHILTKLSQKFLSTTENTISDEVAHLVLNRL